MMDIQLFKNKLKLVLINGLPGIKSHLKLAPAERISSIENQKRSDNAKASAVLIIIFKENEQIKIVFILRSIYQGVHSGQISFPGGKRDLMDNDLLDTALRETEEEIGIEIERGSIIGKLSNLYIPNSNFCVEPYVAYIDKMEQLIPDNSEVQQIYKISLDELLDEKTIQTKEVLFLNKGSVSVPCFYVNELIIWGATAMILNELVDIIKSNDLAKFIH